MIKRLVRNLFLRIYIAFERSRRNLDPDVEMIIRKGMKEQ